MELFQIERYGDGHEVQQVTPEEQMRKLKERIARRKSERGIKNDKVVVNNSVSVEVITQENNKKEKKKKKKRRHSYVENIDLDSKEECDIQNSDDGIIKIKSKTKKKHRKSDTIENGLPEKITRDKVDSSKKSPHKKLKTDRAISDIEDTVDKIRTDGCGGEIKQTRLTGTHIEDSNNNNSNSDGVIDEQSVVENDNKINKKSSSESFPILGKQRRKEKTRVKRTLPRWLTEPMVLPAEIDAGKILVSQAGFVSENMIRNLELAKITHFFPVQACVIPKVLSLYKQTWFPPQDVCVQAPTGSGKTLAYTLPIVEILSKNIVRNLYCLVVLPSKDLAFQVKQVFEFYTHGTRLKVGLISGVKTFAKEQETLVVKGPRSYISKVDILVCTPGRLVDHMKLTEGFSLQHLRFLVIDEADRLLGQDYSGWLDLVMQSRRQIFPLNVHTLEQSNLPLQKLLFSATLTQNPEKLSPLELFKPILFCSHIESTAEDAEATQGTEDERFIVPTELVEKMVVVETGEKPLVLIYLMLTLQQKRVLCFTKSIEGTHRLCLLLKTFGGFTVAEFSSNLSETQRKGIIRDFKSGKIDLLVSSDAMARGMDIEHVSIVVNYDSAANAKTYVHRVGRTARAGTKGEAITILSSKEVFHFKKMMKKLAGSTFSTMKIKTSDISPFEEKYAAALSALQSTVAEEKKAHFSGKFKKNV